MVAIVCRIVLGCTSADRPSVRRMMRQAVLRLPAVAPPSLFHLRRTARSGLIAGRTALRFFVCFDASGCRSIKPNRSLNWVRGSNLSAACGRTAVANWSATNRNRSRLWLAYQPIRAISSIVSTRSRGGDLYSSPRSGMRGA
ncbi:hypothetical protein JI59_16500 [Novosphingobium pentaromativorans US6-1]|nr:hypothetical protein JI59_16500 [Novosphingobium pentaromativorans US6-1]